MSQNRSELQSMQQRTAQVLGEIRVSLIQEAQEIHDRIGSENILISRLASKHGVSSDTARRWLLIAGFTLPAPRKGRPTFEEVLMHDGKLDALAAIKARKD